MLTKYVSKECKTENTKKKIGRNRVQNEYDQKKNKHFEQALPESTKYLTAKNCNHKNCNNGDERNGRSQIGRLNHPPHLFKIISKSFPTSHFNFSFHIVVDWQLIKSLCMISITKEWLCIHYITFYVNYQLYNIIQIKPPLPSLIIRSKVSCNLHCASSGILYSLFCNPSFTSS